MRLRKHNGQTTRKLVWSLTLGGLLATIVTGCSPSTLTPVGTKTESVTAPKATSQSLGTWAPVQAAVALGLQSHRYQEKVTVNITEGSIAGGFQVYGRINPPNMMSVAFHQNGYSMAFYQQGLSAYGNMDGHWQQTPALSSLNLFPEYQNLVKAIMAAGVPVYELHPTQYVLTEYCTVYQASVPARLIATLPSLASSFHPSDTSSVLFTFYIGQKSGELRQVLTSSEGAVTGVGSVGIQTQTELFAINQDTSDITIDPNLYNTLLYQY